jgi:putative thioredoxin
VASNCVFDVDESSFDSKVLKSPVPVILDLNAEWCGPCKTLGPILEKLVKAHRGKVLLAKLDTDENPTLAQTLQGMFCFYHFLSLFPLNTL